MQVELPDKFGGLGFHIRHAPGRQSIIVDGLLSKHHAELGNH